jgi:DNA-binding transcriptional MerR regulator
MSIASKICKRKGVSLTQELAAIPAKKYFTISETAQLCGVKPYILRFWEQEFTQLRPNKRRGNRRYYQHDDLVLIRQIRKLLYEDGFTIEGASLQLRTAIKDTTSANTNNSTQLLINELEALLKMLKSSTINSNNRDQSNHGA